MNKRIIDKAKENQFLRYQKSIMTSSFDLGNNITFYPEIIYQRNKGI